jgi:hypothetical protein
MVGSFPLMTVGCPATNGAVPRSTVLLTRAKTPTAATTVAQARLITTILKWVARSAPYMEWLIVEWLIVASPVL